jgi:hypothetical protein
MLNSDSNRCSPPIRRAHLAAGLITTRRNLLLFQLLIDDLASTARPAGLDRPLRADTP